MIQDIFKARTLYLAMGVEEAAALVIGLAALEAIIRALGAFVERTNHQGGEIRDQLRPGLGRWLALGLGLGLELEHARRLVDEVMAIGERRAKGRASLAHRSWRGHGLDAHRM